MPSFKYSAVDVDGNEVDAVIKADDELAARQQILLQNLDLRSITRKTSLLSADVGGGKKVKPAEILHFSRQLSAFVRSGLSLVDGLDIIAKSTGNKTFQSMLLETRDAVRQGVPFDEALAVHSKILPRYYLGIIRSAELTGRLDSALEQLADYMERELEARTKLKSALTYPAIILLMSLGSVGVLTVWVLPKFTKLFDSMGTDLPWTTSTLIGVSNGARNAWWLIPLLIGAVVGLFLWTKRSPKGRRLRDYALMRLPVAGQIVLYAGVERVCRILSTMWEAGVPIGDAMIAATQAADNAVFEDRLMPVQEAVLAGEGLAGPMALAKLFPDAALQMVSVGEATGTLAEQLENAADFYSRELDYKLKKVTTMFEPAIILFVGLGVGFVALSLVDAMYGSIGSGGVGTK
jgi:type IV pilus assembly protein PilC